MREQSVDGHDNVVVVVDGDRNSATITRDGASLTLERAHRRRGALPKTTRELLLTELRAATLVGRDADLDRFGSWLTTPAPMAVHCDIGWWSDLGRPGGLSGLQPCGGGGAVRLAQSDGSGRPPPPDDPDDGSGVGADPKRVGAAPARAGDRPGVRPRPAKALGTHLTDATGDGRGCAQEPA